jgi:hypothetical protein
VGKKEQLEVLVHALAVVVAIGSAAIGLYTYWRSTRTKAAEFLLELHKSFFVDDTYKAIRDVLDDDSESASADVSLLVSEEPAVFIDFLNFFELVAYMGKEKMISGRDVSIARLLP